MARLYPRAVRSQIVVIAGIGLQNPAMPDGNAIDLIPIADQVEAGRSATGS
jgi:hypothetical protein